MFIPGTTYTRRELHKRYGGQRQDASAFNRRLADVIREKESRVAPAQLRSIRTKAAGRPGDR